MGDEGDELVPLEFLVTAEPDAVVVRWLEPLGKPGSAAYRALTEEFEDLVGVEFVDMRRYSCRLGLAEHVRSTRDLALDVWQVLVADNFRVALRFTGREFLQRLVVVTRVGWGAGADE